MRVTSNPCTAAPPLGKRLCLSGLKFAVDADGRQGVAAQTNTDPGMSVHLLDRVREALVIE